MKELDEIAAIQQADMTKVAAQISAEFGVSIAQATDSIAQVTNSMRKMGESLSGIGPAMSRLPQRELSHLQRIAYMAGALLPAMRDAGLNKTHPAEFSALHAALLALQTSDAGIKPVGDEELVRDLLDLASDLEPPK